MFDIKENLKKLPDSPGVYLHKDKTGQVIYVGKAISLKKRVRQYFQSPESKGPKVRAMVSHIAEFEYITCGTEMEALILECNLIKKYRPKYNVLLRDDKTYPYIEVTVKEKYPRVIKTRLLEKDGNRYFGPYSDAGAVNEAVDLFNRMYSLKRCTKQEFPMNHRPCLNYHIGQCSGICIGKADEEKYRESIEEIMSFLSGREKPLISKLEKEMYGYSDKLQFEEAAKIRDYISALKALTETQRVTLSGDKDFDIVIPVCDNKNSFVVLFTVREGKLSGRETIQIKDGVEEDREILLSQFITQYYLNWADVPPEIVVNQEPEDKALLEDLLSEDGRKVKITLPKKGEKKALLELAQNDVLEILKTISEKAENMKEKKILLRTEIKNLLSESGYGLMPGEIEKDRPGAVKRDEYRIEAYDISNTNGIDSVGAMVVFQGTAKIRKDYRRFRIKTVEGSDDYGSMREVITRRYKRALANEPGFSTFPDLILMDGGLGHVNAAKEALENLGIDIPVIGLAKDDSHRTRAAVFQDGREKELKNSPFLFRYMGRIQEEVHRYAIEYHRKVRGKNSFGSVLDNIEGIGEKRRNALLKHFGSVERIRQATVEDMMEVPEMNEKAAENTYEFFRNNEKKQFKK